MRIMSLQIEPSTAKPRHDGWTPQRKRRFLQSLAEKDDVRRACACVGLSRQAAYTLKKRDPLFAEAWALALRLGRAARVRLIAADLAQRAAGTVSGSSQRNVTPLARPSRREGAENRC